MTLSECRTPPEAWFALVACDMASLACWLEQGRDATRDIISVNLGRFSLRYTSHRKHFSHISGLNEHVLTRGSDGRQGPTPVLPCCQRQGLGGNSGFDSGFKIFILSWVR